MTPRDTLLRDRQCDYLPAEFGEPLSDRERQVLALISCGLQQKEVGSELGIARATVRNHVNAILVKLGARNITHAVRLFYDKRTRPVRHQPGASLGRKG